MTDNNEGAKDRLEGAGQTVKGRVEQGVGGLTGDRATQSKGVFDEVKGKIQQDVGDLKERVDDQSREERE